MNDRVSGIVRHPAFIPAVTGVSSFVIGAGLGYFLGRRQTKNEIELQEENRNARLEEAKTALAVYTDSTPIEEVEDPVITEVDEDEQPIVRPPKVIVEPDEIQDPKALANEFIEQLLESPTPPDDKPEELVLAPERRSVFAANDPDWNFELEKQGRNNTAPYILHRDEFFAEEKYEDGYVQVSLEYYTADDVMVDENNIPIDNYRELVADELKFGHGSGDPNVVYIRNDKRNAEYEIVTNAGSYAIEVLGQETEEMAMAQDRRQANRPGRFRPD